MWQKDFKMNENEALKIINLSKSFQVPMERNQSFRERFARLQFKAHYRLLPVFKKINLTVKRGEWLGIIGANGVGKSTLLKLISGIFEPDEGKIEVKGKLTPFLELGVGFHWELTAADNIFLNGTIMGMTRKQIRQKFGQIIRFAGVENFLEQKLKNFSSGMLVRLGFSVAIQAGGDIYLLDEVLAVGDYQFQQKTKAVFQQLRHLGKTVIFVSHDLESIRQFCDRVIWLNRGRIAAQGMPAAVIREYLKAKV